MKNSVIMTHSVSAEEPEYFMRPRTPSLRERRQSASDLTYLKIVNNNTKNQLFQSLVGSPVTEEETLEEGKALFENFVVEQICEEKPDVSTTPEDIRKLLNIW